MHDLLIIGFRTVLLYVIIVIVLRVMGKREVGELGVIDVVVFIIMAEVAAFALDDPDKKLISFNCSDAHLTGYSTNLLFYFIEK